jgi:hypothetical protein
MSKEPFNTEAKATKEMSGEEIAKEIAGFKDRLQKPFDELTAELGVVRAGKETVQKEYLETLRTYVGDLIPDLKAPLDALDEMTMKVQDLGAQSPSFLRDGMLAARDESMREMGRLSDTPLTIPVFQTALKDAHAAEDAARKDKEDAATALKNAKTEAQNWNRTDGSGFTALNRSIQGTGIPQLSEESRDYYEHSSLFMAALHYTTRGPAYRKVRDTLVEYGHGIEGKDVFSRIADWTRRDEDTKNTLTFALQAAQSTTGHHAETAAALAPLLKHEDTILTDGEIVERLREKVVDFFKTPGFADEAAKSLPGYPRKISVLSAKLDTMDRLEKGIGERLGDLGTTIKTAQEQHDMANYRSSRTIEVDINDVRKKNGEYAAAYEGYASAATRSRGLASTYDPPRSVAYVDNTPTFFQMMLWNNLFYDSPSRYASAPAGDVSPGAGLTGGLLGLNNSHAAQHGLGTAFNFGSDAKPYDLSGSSLFSSSHSHHSSYSSDSSASYTPSYSSPTTFDFGGGGGGGGGGGSFSF